ncbi:MAG: hypothetical protein ABII21_03910 [bacterium]
MKRENKFIAELESKAKEQRKLVETEMMPSWAKGLGDWLVINPWRVLVPLSAIAYSMLRAAYGANMRELILGLFGGFK